MRTLLTVTPILQRQDAGHYFCALYGESLADLETCNVGTLVQDTKGKQYVVNSGAVTDEQYERAVGDSPLTRPSFDTESQVDLTKAAQFKTGSRLWFPEYDKDGNLSNRPIHSYNGIVCLVDVTLQQALDLLGLERVPETV